jgi:hypothetical protein
MITRQQNAIETGSVVLVALRVVIRIARAPELSIEFCNVIDPPERFSAARKYPNTAA